MAKPFTGYTKQQAIVIHQTLITAHLKPRTNWPRLLATITDEMYSVTCPEIRLKDTRLYRSEVTRRLIALTDALDATVKAHKELGEGLQTHLDEQLPHVPLVRDGYSSDWRTTVRCLLSSDQFPRALDAVKQAAVQAATRPSPYLSVPTTGAPPDPTIREAVYALLDTFKRATGIPPIVSSSPYTEKHKEGYTGNFYPFAIACLTPVFPATQLGSAILTAYKEWRSAREFEQEFLAQKK